MPSRRSQSATRESISRPAAAARSFAVSINAGARSTPVTSAPARAARSATAPVPHATSRKRSPAFGARRCTRMSWRSSIVSDTFWYGPLPHIRLWRCFSSSNAMPRHLRVLRRFFLFRAGRQLIARAPQRREEVVMDHLPEHLDRRPLRPDNLVADDPRDDLVVADAPHRDPLVPLDQRLGELVQILVLAAADVHLDDIEPRGCDGGLERRADRRRDTPDVAESG